MAVMNSDSSSSDDDGTKKRKYFIGKTRGISWAEELEDYLEGKYTVIDGDNGAALQKQKSNVKKHIVGVRKREIKPWFASPGDPLIPVIQDDGSVVQATLESLTLSELLEAIGNYFDDDKEGEDAQYYFFKTLKLKKGEKVVDFNCRVAEALRECPDIDNDSIQVRARYCDFFVKDQGEPT